MAPPPPSPAALFDALAPSYDAVGVDFFRPIAAGLVHAMRPQPNEHWLDLGCGRGAVIAPVADSIGPAGRVVGVDVSPEMIEMARHDLADRPNVQLVVGDAQHPSVLLHHLHGYDAVSACLVLFFLPDPALALVHWHDLLRPGGRVGITTFGPMDERWAKVDSVFEPYLPPAMRDARTTGKSGPFSSDKGMEHLLSHAGFIDVHTVTETIDVHFADAAQWEAFSWSTGQRAVWMNIPEADRPLVRDEAYLLLRRYQADNGSITFQQSVRHSIGRRAR